MSGSCVIDELLVSTIEVGVGTPVLGDGGARGHDRRTVPGGALRPGAGGRPMGRAPCDRPARRAPAGRQRDLCLAVNLSAHSVTDNRLIALITDRLAATNADPRGLCFELTETAAIINVDRARDFARHLTNLGCEFALDDFEAGFASFYYPKVSPRNRSRNSSKTSQPSTSYATTASTTPRAITSPSPHRFRRSRSTRRLLASPQGRRPTHGWPQREHRRRGGGPGGRRVPTG
jgi:hypothetical protein